MARDKGHLTDLHLRHWIKAGKPLAKADGDGLTFTLSTAGVAGWILRYRYGGRRRELTIGRYPDIGLAEARGIATLKRAEVQQGRNPAAEKQKAKATAARDWTVRDLAKDYRAKKLVSLAHSTQVSYGRHLKRVEKKLGALTVREIEASDVVALIESAGLTWGESNMLLITTKCLFTHACGKRLINANPCHGIMLSALLGERPPRRQRLMLTREELKLLLAAPMRRRNALASGRHAIGTDISSLATFVSEVKTTLYGDDDLARLQRWCECIADGINILEPVAIDAHYEEAGYTKHPDSAANWRLKKAIEQVIATARELKPKRLEDFARCVLLRTSQWALNGRKKLPSIDDFRAMLVTDAASMIDGARELRRAALDDRGREASQIICLNRSTKGLESDATFADGRRPRLVVADAIVGADGHAAGLRHGGLALRGVDGQQPVAATLGAAVRVQVARRAVGGAAGLLRSQHVLVGPQHQAFLEAQAKGLHQPQRRGGVPVVGFHLADHRVGIHALGAPGLVHRGRQAAAVQRGVVEVAGDGLQQVRLADPAGKGAHEAEVGLDGGRAHASGVRLGLPVRGDRIDMPAAERARVELEALGVLAQEGEEPVAEARPLGDGLVAHALVLAAVAPVVLLQDQVEHIGAAARVQRQIGQCRLLVGAWPGDGPGARGAACGDGRRAVRCGGHGASPRQSNRWNPVVQASAGSGADAGPVACGGHPEGLPPRGGS